MEEGAGTCRVGHAFRIGVIVVGVGLGCSKRPMVRSKAKRPSIRQSLKIWTADL